MSTRGLSVTRVPSPPPRSFQSTMASACAPGSSGPVAAPSTQRRGRQADPGPHQRAAAALGVAPDPGARSTPGARPGAAAGRPGTAARNSAAAPARYWSAPNSEANTNRPAAGEHRLERSPQPERRPVGQEGGDPQRDGGARDEARQRLGGGLDVPEQVDRGAQVGGEGVERARRRARRGGWWRRRTASSPRSTSATAETRAASATGVRRRRNTAAIRCDSQHQQQRLAEERPVQEQPAEAHQGGDADPDEGDLGRELQADPPGGAHRPATARRVAPSSPGRVAAGEVTGRAAARRPWRHRPGGTGRTCGSSCRGTTGPGRPAPGCSRRSAPPGRCRPDPTTTARRAR